MRFQSASEVQQNRNKIISGECLLQGSERVSTLQQGITLIRMPPSRAQVQCLECKLRLVKKARPKPQQDTEIDEDEESLSRPKLS